MDNTDQNRRIKRTVLLGTGLALVLFAVIFAFYDEGGEDVEYDAATQRLMLEIGAEPIGEPLLDRQLLWRLDRDAAGHVFRLADLPEDTVVFLNLWATWCQPCVDELPSMLKLAERMQGRRFTMVAVSYDDAWEDIEVFFDKLSGGMPPADRLLVVRDPTQRGEPLRATLGTFKLPETYVIYNGMILARFVNLRDWTDPSIIRYFEQLAPRQ